MTLKGHLAYKWHVFLFLQVCIDPCSNDLVLNTERNPPSICKSDPYVEHCTYHNSTKCVQPSASSADSAVRIS